MKINYEGYPMEVTDVLEDELELNSKIWTLDFENQPQETCATVAMLGIVIPNLPADALSGNALISITDVPEIINRYEYSYHPKKRS